MSLYRDMNSRMHNLGQPYSAMDMLPATKDYPIHKSGYHRQGQSGQSGQPKSKTPMQSYADMVETARKDCKTCQTGPVDNKGQPIGCSVTTSGTPENFEHVNVRQNRPFSGETFITNDPNAPVYVHAAGAPGQREPISQQLQITPQYGQYGADLFKMPWDRVKPKISTGVMTNAYTGEILETFEDAIPPPNTDQSLDEEQFQKTQPKLIWHNGGIDPNAPLPHKREVVEDIPQINAGANPWGDQLYEPQRRKRMEQIVERQIWNNRNGDYACEPSTIGEAPAGYIGLQPVYRAIPYMPPTQILDTKDWKGPVDAIRPEGNTNPLVVPRTTTHKVDLTRVEYFGNPGSTNGQDAVQVVPVVVNRPTWRGRSETVYGGPADFGDFNPGAHVVIDTKPRETLKELMGETFPVNHADFTVGNPGSYVVIDTKARDTLKELMAEERPVTSASDPSIGERLPFQGPLEGNRRMYYSDKSHPTFVSGVSGSGEYVGPGNVYSSQHRGTYETDYRIPNKVTQEGGGDTHSRWIGYHDRDVKRRASEQYTPNPDFSSSAAHIAGRMVPEVQYSCKKPDSVDDEFISVRPDHFRFNP